MSGVALESETHIPEMVKSQDRPVRGGVEERPGKALEGSHPPVPHNPVNGVTPVSICLCSP